MTKNISYLNMQMIHLLSLTTYKFPKLLPWSNIENEELLHQLEESQYLNHLLSLKKII